MYLENIVAIFKSVIFIEAKRVQGYQQGPLNTDCYMIYEIYITFLQSRMSRTKDWLLTLMNIKQNNYWSSK